MITSEWGHLDIMKYLTEKGTDVNAKNRDGDTALMVASSNGKREMVKLLLANGAVKP